MHVSCDGKKIASKGKNTGSVFYSVMNHYFEYLLTKEVLSLLFEDYVFEKSCIWRSIKFAISIMYENAWMPLEMGR